MMPRKSRFTRASFPSVKPRSRVSFPWGAVAVFGSDQKKAAVVVSKKVLAKAHDRNRVRRRLYEAIAKAFPEKTHAAVVYPRREALTVPFETLVLDLKKALR